MHANGPLGRWYSVSWGGGPVAAGNDSFPSRDLPWKSMYPMRPAQKSPL